MQFDHAHGFRPQVRDLLLAEWPEAWQTWSSSAPCPIDMSSLASPLRDRRPVASSTYERALRRAAAGVRGLTVAAGTSGGLVEATARVRGRCRRRGGARRRPRGRRQRPAVAAVAFGRAALDGDTGMAYVTRTYRRHPGARPGPDDRPGGVDAASSTATRPTSSPTSGGHLSVVIVRPTADAGLTVLRHVDAFDAACRAIPGLAEWTDPALAMPTSGVLVGGRLRQRLPAAARPPGSGAVGDSVATTAPTAGRGVAMASMQIAALLACSTPAPTRPRSPRRSAPGATRDPALGRGPPRLRRRGGAPLAGRRPRPRAGR